MKRVVWLLVLAALWQSGCAATSGTDGSSVVRRASSCAMCGASVSGDYFSATTDKAIGPGRNW